MCCFEIVLTTSQNYLNECYKNAVLKNVKKNCFGQLQFLSSITITITIMNQFYFELQLQFQLWKQNIFNYNYDYNYAVIVIDFQLHNYKRNWPQPWSLPTSAANICYNTLFENATNWHKSFLLGFKIASSSILDK